MLPMQNEKMMVGMQGGGDICIGILCISGHAAVRYGAAVGCVARESGWVGEYSFLGCIVALGE